MKKKAIVKTIIDLLKIVIYIVIWFASLFLILYLFIKLPFWVADIFNLVEIFSNYPAGIIYGIELVIIFSIVFVISFIYAVYKNNLEELKTKETEVLNKQNKNLTED